MQMCLILELLDRVCHFKILIRHRLIFSRCRQAWSENQIIQFVLDLPRVLVFNCGQHVSILCIVDIQNEKVRKQILLIVTQFHVFCHSGMSARDLLHEEGEGLVEGIHILQQLFPRISHIPPLRKINSCLQLLKAKMAIGKHQFLANKRLVLAALHSLKKTLLIVKIRPFIYGLARQGFLVVCIPLIIICITLLKFEIAIKHFPHTLGVTHCFFGAI